MTNIIKLGSYLLGVTLAAASLSAQADPKLSAKHQTIGTSYGDGIYTIELEIQVANTGDQSLQSIVLTPQDPSLMVSGIAQAQAVGNLDTGQSVKLTWTLNSLMPMEYFQGLPLLLEGEAQTAAGESIRLNVESIGG